MGVPDYSDAVSADQQRQLAELAMPSTPPAKPAARQPAPQAPRPQHLAAVLASQLPHPAAAAVAPANLMPPASLSDGCHDGAAPVGCSPDLGPMTAEPSMDLAALGSPADLAGLLAGL